MWDNPETVAALVGEHLVRRPAMRLPDVYKLLFQGVLGSEHLLAAPDEFAARLRAEWEAAAADASEPLLECIRPDQGLARVNLRPHKAQGGDLEELTASCLEAAQGAWGTPEDLRGAWSAFVEMCMTGPMRIFPADEVSSFSHWLTYNGYPAVHHSPRYRELYRPAYRLVRPW